MCALNGREHHAPPPARGRGRPRRDPSQAGRGRQPEGLGTSWLLQFLPLVLRRDTQLPVSRRTRSSSSRAVGGGGGFRLRLVPQMAARPPSCGKPDQRHRLPAHAEPTGGEQGRISPRGPCAKLLRGLWAPESPRGEEGSEALTGHQASEPFLRGEAPHQAAPSGSGSRAVEALSEVRKSQPRRVAPFTEAELRAPSSGAHGWRAAGVDAPRLLLPHPALCPSPPTWPLHELPSTARQ